MAGVRGDFGGLVKLRKALEQTLSPEFKSKMAMVQGAAAMKCLGDEFRQSKDPYGNAWKPLQLRRGKPLLDTGRMRASAALVQTANGFGIDVGVKYFTTHQYGASIVPKNGPLLSWKVRGVKRRFFATKVVVPRRQMLPEEDTGGLGAIWTAAIDKATDAFVRLNFQGVG